MANERIKGNAYLIESNDGVSNSLKALLEYLEFADVKQIRTFEEALQLLNNLWC